MGLAGRHLDDAFLELGMALDALGVPRSVGG